MVEAAASILSMQDLEHPVSTLTFVEKGLNLSIIRDRIPVAVRGRGANHVPPLVSQRDIVGQQGGWFEPAWNTP